MSMWSAKQRRVGLRLGVAVLLVGWFAAGTAEAGVKSAQRTREPFKLVFYKVETSYAKTDEHQKLAEIVEAILLQSIRREFENTSGRLVRVKRLPEGPPTEEDKRLSWAHELQAAGDHFYLGAELSFLEQGYALRVNAVSLADTGAPGWRWPTFTDTQIISGREPDLEKMEKLIGDLSERVVERFERGPDPVVLAWCIQARDRSNYTLASLGRRLTLELPYYLSAREKLKKYIFVGLTAPEYVADCSEGKPSYRAEDFTYVISGEVSLLPEGKVLVELWVDSRKLGQSIPLGSFPFKEKDLSVLPQNLAKEIEISWEKSISTPLESPTAQD